MGEVGEVVGRTKAGTLIRLPEQSFIFAFGGVGDMEGHLRLELIERGSGQTWMERWIHQIYDREINQIDGKWDVGYDSDSWEICDSDRILSGAI